MATRSAAQATTEATVDEPAAPDMPPSATAAAGTAAKAGGFRFTVGSYPNFDLRGTKLVELMQDVKDHHGRQPLLIPWLDKSQPCRFRSRRILGRPQPQPRRLERADPSVGSSLRASSGPVHGMLPICLAACMLTHAWLAAAEVQRHEGGLGLLPEVPLAGV